MLNAYSGDELVYSKTLGDWRTHNGVDYACAEGSAVSAPCSGKVTETGTDGRWSSVVTLEDASGRLWRGPRRETRRHRDRWAEAGHRGHHQL